LSECVLATYKELTPTYSKDGRFGSKTNEDQHVKGVAAKEVSGIGIESMFFPSLFPPYMPSYESEASYMEASSCNNAWVVMTGLLSFFVSFLRFVAYLPEYLV
jgi:hypothetical protein